MARRFKQISPLRLATFASALPAVPKPRHSGMRPLGRRPGIQKLLPLDSGFARRARCGMTGMFRLFALEVRRALVEERIHALAKILAHVGAQDEVLALFAAQRTADAAHRFLRDF